MRWMLAALALAVFALPPAVLVAGPASDDQPSLTELARREKLRRKQVGEPVRVITEAELRGAGARYRPAPEDEFEAGEAGEAGEAAAEGAPGSEAEAPAAPEEKTVEELREEKRVELQARLDEVVARMARVREAMDGAQRELGDLSSLTYGGRRAALMKLVEDGQAEIDRSEAELAEIEEQARRERVVVRRP